jgi:hypothetical protein
MRVLHVAPVICLGLVACGSLTGSSSPLAGAWRTAAIPSGSGIGLTLTTNGLQVTGKGYETTLQYLADSLTVSGRQLLDQTFLFDITFGSGATATYVGRLEQDQLNGTWTDAGHSPSQLIFYRQVQ